MNELEKKNTEIATLAEFDIDLNKAKDNVPVMIDRTNKAMMAMTQITEITSDEMDEHANNILVKVRKTYDAVSEQRKEITDGYDAFKKTIMLIEGELDPKKGKDNDYNRIKILREGYAQIKLDKRRKEEEELARKKLIANKIIDLKTALVKNIELGPLNLIAKAQDTLNTWVTTLTLENFDEKAKQLDYTPKLKGDAYDGWFNVTLDLGGVSQEDIDKTIAEVKKSHSFEKTGKEYQKTALESLDEWKKKLPEIRKRLEDIDAASAEDAENLKVQLAAKALVEKQAADKKSKEIADAKAKEIEDEASDSKLEAEFVEQGGVQNLDDAKVNAKFVARFNQDNWVRPFAAVVYHVAIHDKFKGIFAKERSGETKKDDKGRDQYIDQIDWFLKFFAANCDAKIEGLKIYQDAKTQARKKKD